MDPHPVAELRVGGSVSAYIIRWRIAVPVSAVHLATLRDDIMVDGMVNDPLALADPVQTTPGSGAPPTSTASTPQNIASVEQMYRLRMLGAYRKFIEAAAHSARLDVADQRARETCLRRFFRAHASNKTTKTILQKLNRISIAATALANARRL